MLGKGCLGCFVSLILVFLGCLFLGFITKIVFALSIGLFILAVYILGVVLIALVIYNAIKFLLTA